MGAAFCAGIAAGVYSKEIFQAVRRSRFLPGMEAALRRKKREAGSRRWKRCSPGLGQNKSSRRSILCKWNVGTYWKSR